MTRRVAVYGKDTKEKTQLMDQLGASTQLEFCTSTPPDRFRQVLDGRKPPFSMASLQILFLNLADETNESIGSIEREYRLCDFKRPLMFLLKGTPDGEIKTKLQAYLPNNHIVIRSINKIEDLDVADITIELERLGQDFYGEKPTSNNSM